MCIFFFSFALKYGSDTCVHMHESGGDNAKLLSKSARIAAALRAGLWKIYIFIALVCARKQ